MDVDLVIGFPADRSRDARDIARRVVFVGRRPAVDVVADRPAAQAIVIGPEVLDHRADAVRGIDEHAEPAMHKLTFLHLVGAVCEIAYLAVPWRLTAIHVARIAVQEPTRALRIHHRDLHQRKNHSRQSA